MYGVSALRCQCLLAMLSARLTCGSVGAVCDTLEFPSRSATFPGLLGAAVQHGSHEFVGQS